MEIRYFEDSDLPLVNQWLALRGKPPIMLAELPEAGIIAFENDLYIAAGFLRRGEDIGIIDSMITNPVAGPELRNQALDMIFKVLLEIAQGSNFYTVIGASIDDSTIERSKKFGFVESDYKLMVLKFEGA